MKKMTPLARVIVEKNGIMNVREGYLDENGDEEDTRHDSGEEDDVCVEKRKTETLRTYLWMFCV